MGLHESLKKIAAIMNRFSDRGEIKGYALIGGLSVSVWKAPRGTRDIDLLVSLDPPEHINKFCKALEAEGLDPEVLKGGVGDPVPYLIKLSHKGVPVDIIVSTRKWEDEAISNAAAIDFQGVKIQVVSAEYLIAIKLKAGGPMDLLDAHELLQIEDLDMARVESLAKRLRVDKRLVKVKRGG
ncbi:MAG: nucleotidyltransferase [Nitrospirae bacterium]|nr:nucleotidyltransferase [Nitrospirota bacterium]